ncbi:MAG: ATP-binding protein [Halanaerobiales bacterium]
MKELALHILDIVQNSISADADTVTLEINENTKKKLLTIKIKDDGKGIEKNILKNITDPFVTSREARPVGLGLSLFKAAAERCEGSFKIESDEKGTTVKAVFKKNHIDRAPLGAIAQSVVSILLWDSEIDFKYIHTYNNKKFVFDTEVIKNKLDGIEITNKKIINWLKNYIKENVSEIRGGEFN